MNFFLITFGLCVKFSYIVEYMKFLEVIGQENIKRLLICEAKVNHVFYVLFFDGPEGIGKLSLIVEY